MFTMLIKQFMKKIATLVAGAAAMLLMSSAGTCTLLLAGSLTASFDAQALTIDNASWRQNRGRIYIVVSGGDAGRRNTVRVYDADTGSTIGSDRSNERGDWSLTDRLSRGSTEDDLPCRVRAQRDNQSVEADVIPAPSHCTPPPPVYQCSDGIDNDSDGLIDFPADPGCTDANDDDEFNAPPPNAQCNDGIDNDGDGLIDFPADPGCTDANDNDETNAPPIDPGFANQTDFKIMMNYELGMHCTGFEFAYCCVLPAYNSILAQVVKPDSTGQGYPELLEGDPNVGKDALGRETVVRDREQAGNNFKKYVLTYWHEAQPRNDGRGKAQLSNLISAVEGNSLLSWNTTFDSAALNADGTFVTGSYNGADGVVLGDGKLGQGADNYQNAIWNHLYFYEDLEGGNSTNTSLDSAKIRLGVNGHVVYPADCGPALHPMGPVTTGGANDCGGFSNGNVLTFSGDKGTVVYTQMKVLENLPIMLTSPDIWEALGLPLTPFEDSIDFFSDPGLVDEDSVRPFVAMKAQLYTYDAGDTSAQDGDAVGVGSAVLDGNGDPVIGFGTAPIDIPNCERCHSNGPDGTLIENAANEGGGTLVVANSPNNDGALYALVQQEYSFWTAYYNIDTAAGDSDWYARLKSAAISMLKAHDTQHGTEFADRYTLDCASPTDPNCGALPQNTRLGHESIICQRCHADNVIAAVKSATHGGDLIPPVTEAIHNNHKGAGADGPIAFSDSLGRDGGCQGCHPAHRSDGDMAGYPITLAGTNRYADGDNRGANGGCFVGRDVHSNPNKDNDGAETPEHLNAVGQWLADNVASDGNGIWCTNCHNQLGQEMWKTENMTSLVHNQGSVNPRGEASLAAVAAAVGVSEDQAISWLDPKSSNPVDDTYAIWKSDPGLCNYVAGAFGVIPVDPAHDGNVATVEVNVTSAEACSTGGGTGLIDCGATYPGAPAFHICGTVDGDGDFSVNAMDFCTTPDCVAAAQATLPAGSVAVPVPFSAATDGRDHWLSAGEPHCADCHAAPFTEQSGNINAYPPFNYPRKASLMRYSKGHQGITCQGCHESIHGLYPVTPNIDTTTYAQAAALNEDGSHGPLKCSACHEVDGQGIPQFMNANRSVYSVPGYGAAGINSFDEAVAWAHIYTDEQSVLDTTCQNCHGVQGTNWNDMGTATNPNDEYTDHADRGRVSRQMMDKAEIEKFGAVLTSTDGSDGVCTSCHGNEASHVSCGDHEWRDHLTEGRVAASTFEHVSTVRTGANCW